MKFTDDFRSLLRKIPADEENDKEEEVEVEDDEDGDACDHGG